MTASAKKAQETKKLIEYVNSQQTKQTSNLASFILSNYVINYDTTLLNSNNNKTVDRPIENRELTIDKVKHPEHEKWLAKEIDRLKEADSFRELDL